jgi:hypothetical protein
MKRGYNTEPQRREISRCGSAYIRLGLQKASVFFISCAVVCPAACTGVLFGVLMLVYALPDTAPLALRGKEGYNPGRKNQSDGLSPKEE